MELSAVYETLEEIPEQFRELYAEKNNQWELAGIDGVATQASVDRLRESLQKEREAHKDTKRKLSIWDGWDKEHAQSQLDKVVELEDEQQNRKVNDAIREAVAPFFIGSLNLAIFAYNHLFSMKEGGNALGSVGPDDLDEVNPFEKETWNLTAQLEMVKNDPAKARLYAIKAGTSLNIE